MFCRDRSVFCFDHETTTQLWNLKTGHLSDIHDVDFYQGIVVTGSRDATVKVGCQSGFFFSSVGAYRLVSDVSDVFENCFCSCGRWLNETVEIETGIFYTQSNRRTGSGRSLSIHEDSKFHLTWCCVGSFGGKIEEHLFVGCGLFFHVAEGKQFESIWATIFFSVLLLRVPQASTTYHLCACGT